ncbi:hypothetical protein [Bradyrhizobium sp.]|uniref:hypothetical protein n=1 Tax=Bradyrhizobium sp. TaxID=376 RepID=UPI0025BDB387|nr:hypothetical protein [Bradyrhizobium sp.]
MVAPADFTGRRRLTLRRRIVAVALTAAIASIVLGATATAQSQPPFGDRWKNVPAKPTAPPAEKLPVSVEQAFYLIRSTLLTLNDANRSGNYTVLRDLAAPDFQAKNSAADLADGFADLRRRKFDLFAAALVAPELTAAPALDGKGMLRLTGHFPTRPQQIDFDLLFQNVSTQWRLFGIAVATPPAAAAQATPAAQAKAPTAAH